MAETKPTTAVAAVNPLTKMEAAIAAAKNVKDLLKINVVANRYVSNFMAATGADEQSAKTQFEREAFAFIELANKKDGIMQCDPMSIFAGFIKAGMTGLSFDSNKLSVYPKGVKQKDGSYIQHLVVEPDAHGKKEMMERMPEIKKIDEGIVVFNDDVFTYSPKIKLVTKHEQTFPKPKASKDTVKAAYCTIHFADGHDEDVVMSINEIEIARSKSQQPNGMMWSGSYEEACKKTTYNRAYKVNYKRPTKAFVYQQFEQPETVETTAQVMDAPVEDLPPVVVPDNIDRETGEVLDMAAPPAEVKVEKSKTTKRRQSEEQSFIPQA